jgi:hypothetical protein
LLRWPNFSSAIQFTRSHASRLPAGCAVQPGLCSTICCSRDEQRLTSTRPHAFAPEQDCLRHAKALGYQVVVTHLSPDAVDIANIDWTRPTAFVLGNEQRGEGAGMGWHMCLV